jgi:hypothetical protein
MAAGSNNAGDWGRGTAAAERGITGANRVAACRLGAIIAGGRCADAGLRIARSQGASVFYKFLPLLVSALPQGRPRFQYGADRDDGVDSVRHRGSRRSRHRGSRHSRRRLAHGLADLSRHADLADPQNRGGDFCPAGRRPRFPPRSLQTSGRRSRSSPPRSSADTQTQVVR